MKLILTAALGIGWIVIVWMEYNVATIKKINYFMPKSYAALISSVKDKGKIDTETVREYKYYYNLLTQYVPGMAEPYGMVGFCSFYLKEYDKALTAYQKAIDRNPSFFWFYYNQGVVYYALKDYSMAADSLKKALMANKELTLKFIVSSRRIYMPIALEETGDAPAWLKNELQQGLQKTLVLLKQIELKAQHKKEMSLPDAEIELKIY
ncbi:MAG: hypothetical protein A2Z88_03165 [Omnitrophica WOR_2 bacterium GWA2_47_8]|nr:MAG: hypothetical protein A2Z88_03165 [Omnitrophica WOR_2 bacterium GWA2_47_8]